MSFTTSQVGINLIKSFEACKLTAYQDSAGVWTIGCGHTSGVKSGMKITQAQADAYLKADLKTSENAVNKKVTYSIKQNQFDVWIYAGGEVLDGLVRRRAAEKELFLNGTTGGSGSATGDNVCTV